MTNLAAAAQPQLPFNPFTAPLAAVTAHIELLKKQKEFLQAQSDAFGGSSSTTATPLAFTIGDLKRTTSATDLVELATTGATLAATNGVVQKFTLNADLAGASQIDFIMSSGDGSTSVIAADRVQDLTASALKPLWTTAGSDAYAVYSDGPSAEFTSRHWRSDPCRCW